MRKFILLFILLILYHNLLAQIVYEPVNSPVYEFLEQMSVKGIITYQDIIKPLARKNIANYLIEIKKQENKLSKVEKDELYFYLNDYQDEIKRLSCVKDTTESYNFIYPDFQSANLFNYKNELFTINADIIYGYSIQNKFGKKFTHRWNGASVYGYLSDKLGYYFNFRDNREESKILDPAKTLTDEMGITAIPKDDGLEYSEAMGGLSYDWNWGSISFVKDYLTWGYEKSGNVVLGRKAPTYPYIRLDINPAPWFSFNYIHAFLESRMIDSLETYKIYTYQDVDRVIYRKKFFASHTVTIKYKGLSLSAGESMVYGDEIKALYLLPVMFFRLADHYYSNNNNDAGDNAQFFFNISSKNHIPNTHIYTTLFIDEITLSDMFDKQKQRYQVAMNFGLSNYGLFFDNFGFTVEYTKIFPFAYQHYIKTTEYSSSNYSLGHWLGDNGDIFYLSSKYKIFRGLDIEAYYKYLRKGNGGLSDSLMRLRQYTVPQPQFLWGKVTNRTYVGAKLSYQFWHNLFFQFHYEYTNFKDELNDFSRTFDYQLGKNHNFNISIYYRL